MKEKYPDKTDIRWGGVCGEGSAYRKAYQAVASRNLVRKKKAVKNAAEALAEQSQTTTQVLRPQAVSVSAGSDITTDQMHIVEDVSEAVVAVGVSMTEASAMLQPGWQRVRLPTGVEAYSHELAGLLNMGIADYQLYP